MLYDGISLTQGTSVTNLEIENVTTLPAVSVEDRGRVVYLTTAYSSYGVGPYVNDGTKWNPIQTGDAIYSVTINNGTGITGGGTGSTFTLAVDTNVIATKTYVDSVSATVSPTGDSYYQNVSLLMHMDGTDGSQVFTDNSQYARTISVQNGVPQLSTTTSKFGPSSARFSNNTSGANTSNTLYMPAGGAAGPLDLSSGDFTIEFFMKATSSQTTRHIIGSANAFSGTGGWGVRLDGSGLVLLGNSGSQGSVSWSWTTNTWYHVAIARSGSTTKIFIDGTQVGSNLTPSFAAETVGSYVWIAGHVLDNNNGSYAFDGYLDEIRVTKGVARYTTNFTAPTTAFLNQSPLVNGIYTNSTITNTGNSNYPTLGVASAYTPYDVGSCVIGKPDAGATCAIIAAPRAFNIPSGYTASVAKSGASATASSVFTILKNGSSIGTFTFGAGSTTGSFSGAGGSIAAGDLISITAPATQDGTLANIAFTIAGNLQ